MVDPDVPSDGPSAPTCFVVMPIGRAGSDKHTTFRAIYEEMFKKPLEQRGFVVHRADDVEDTGNITTDIVTAIATADLVLADLTNLNPNVFYEVGVRHALMGYGTIMVAEAGEVETLPFDLKAHRVLPYTADLSGVAGFVGALDGFVTSFQAARHDRRDNPVHDALPSLPRNALRSAREEEAGSLRTEIARLNQLVRAYEKRLPTVGDLAEPRSTPPVVLDATRELIKEKRLPSDLVRAAFSAAQQQDKERFVEAVREILRSTDPELDANEYRFLASQANLLNLGRVGTAIMQFGAEQLPEDESLQDDYLTNLCHSSRREDRDIAIEALLMRVGVTVDEGGAVTMRDDDDLSSRDLRKIGLVLDALHSNNENERALRITTALLGSSPDDSRVLRNHARALESVRRAEDGLQFYREALAKSSVDTMCGVWLGNTLQNNRQYADAAEAYAVGCLLDLDESAAYGHLFDAVINGKYFASTGKSRATRKVPDEITETALDDLLRCLMSCSSLTAAEVADLVQEQGKAIALGLDSVAAKLAALSTGDQAREHVILEERRRIVEAIYTALRSELTAAFPVGTDVDQQQ